MPGYGQSVNIKRNTDGKDILINDDGSIATTLISGDIQIGAVELKDKDSTNRAVVSSDGALSIRQTGGFSVSLSGDNSIKIIDSAGNNTATVFQDGAVKISGDVRFSGQDIQIGAVEIKDSSTDNRAQVYQNVSGDYGLSVLPISTHPLHSSQINPSYSFTRNVSGDVTQIQMVVSGTTYTKDFSRNVSGDVMYVTSWY